MTKHSPTYRTFDIVLAPFPFFDSPGGKIRPCLVLSSHDYFNKLVNQCTIAMITSAKNSSWPYDIKISDPLRCGLAKPCVIRLRLLTIPNNIVLKPLGKLSSSDRLRVQEGLQKIFHDLPLFTPSPVQSIKEFQP